MKRIFLFLMTNIAVMVVLSASMSVLGVGRFMTANGLDLTQLLIFSALIGFTGSIISFLISKCMATQSTGARAIHPHAPATAKATCPTDTVPHLTARPRTRRPARAHQ